MSGPENPFALWQELGRTMTDNMTVVRYNDRLEKQLGILADLKERYQRIGVSDVSGWTNQVLPFTRQLWNMLILAEVMTKGALLRDESRGAHYKPDFPDRDDRNFLKTTIAEHTPDGPKIMYESVDISLVKPRPRKYTSDAPAARMPMKDGKAPVAAALVANGVSGAVPLTVPGEETVSGGLSKTTPNRADIEPGKGGAN